MFLGELAVINVVEEAHHPPIFLILAVIAGKVAHGSLHRQGMLHQGIGVDVFFQVLQSLLPGAGCGHIKSSLCIIFMVSS